MDWKALEKVPHIAYFPQESACIWRQILGQRGIFMPRTIHEWKLRFDASPRSLPPTLFLSPSLEDEEQLRQHYGFPVFAIPLLPTEPELSQVLASALSVPIPGLLVQSDIADRVVNRATGADIVLLLVFDGLAYEDVLDWTYPSDWRCRRNLCLVDGLSSTHSAMPRVVGTPPLTHRLFKMGFRQRTGFTYWEREANPLTDMLFAEFSDRQLIKVSEFAQILKCLERESFDTRTYVQIIRHGLDQFCHGYRERPSIPHFLGELQNSVRDILELLSSFQMVTRVFITADHGILWYDNQKILSSVNRGQSARYIANNVPDPGAELVNVHDVTGNYAALVGTDRILRKRRINEWGFHGGVSGRESLVPLVELEYRP